MSGAASAAAQVVERGLDAAAAGARSGTGQAQLDPAANSDTVAAA
jgi:hypothetical protein